jgi:hypothetical protein
MNAKEMQKFTLILSGCFAGLLVLAAVLFSMVFDWGGRHPRLAAALGENCRPVAAADAPSNGEGAAPPASLAARDEDIILPLLDDAEDNPAATGDSEEEPSAPGEKPLEDTPDQAPAAKPADGASHSSLAPTPKMAERPSRALAAQAAANPSALALPAPPHVSPRKAADLRKKRFVRFHWDAVSGAAGYHIRAWQFEGNKQIMLIDSRVSETEVLIEPKLPAAPVQWEVAAVDRDGNVGEVAGPHTIDLLKRFPAASKK